MFTLPKLWYERNRWGVTVLACPLYWALCWGVCGMISLHLVLDSWWGGCLICWTHGIKYSELLSCLPGNYSRWHVLESSRYWCTTCPCLMLKSAVTWLHHFVCKTARFRIGGKVPPSFLCMWQVSPSVKCIEQITWRKSLSLLGAFFILNGFSAYTFLETHPHILWALSVFWLGCGSQSEITNSPKQVLQDLWRSHLFWLVSMFAYLCARGQHSYNFFTHDF